MNASKNIMTCLTIGLIAMSTAVAKAEEKKEAKETKVKLSDCPAAVQKTLQREAGGATLNEIVKETEHGKTTFEAEAKIDGKEYDIEVAEDGTLLKKELSDDEEEEGKKKEDEPQVKLSDCPAAVQKTLAREAFGGAIDMVEKEQEDGKTIYEADVKIDGKNYEIKVAADGVLLCKQLDEDDDAEEEHSEKKEHSKKEHKEQKGHHDDDDDDDE